MHTITCGVSVTAAGDRERCLRDVQTVYFCFCFFVTVSLASPKI